MKKINVKINTQESEEVEKLFFKYCSLKDLIGFLIREEMNESTIDRYIEDYNEVYHLLEKTKDKVTKKNMPKELKNKDIGYSFNFEEHSIEFTYND